jgi:YebC/PmpR family DNA-binding regulatory protein
VSGHSKWHSIKHKKGVTDKKRGQLFSKLTRAIIVAARDGGADPAANLALQNAIEKAREASVPKDNIERAIARGAGTSGEGAAAYEHVSYEGYGPGGVAVFVEALTDNRNRTASEVRHIFAKNEGSLGESGSVAWLFERTGVVLVSDSFDEDELTLAAAEGGADDVARDGAVFQVTCPPEALAAVRGAIEEAGMEVESAQLSMLPKTTVAVEEEAAARRIVRLMEALEENDDVQDVYANFDIPEAVLEAAAV